jgi:hypothetical protein
MKPEGIYGTPSSARVRAWGTGPQADRHFKERIGLIARTEIERESPGKCRKSFAGAAGQVSRGDRVSIAARHHTQCRRPRE